MKQSHDPSAGSHAAASVSAAQEPAPIADALAGVDLLSDVLRSVRLTGSMYFLVEASTPWMTWAPAASTFASAVLPQAQHLISYHVITSGTCWGGLDRAAPQRLEAGDILVVPHGAPYFLAAPPTASPSYGDTEAMSFFRRMAAGDLPSIVAEGGGGPDKCHFICGFLRCDIRPFNPLLGALPEMMVLRRGSAGDERMDHLVRFALRALRERGAGDQEVLLRLSELMFVEVLRRHLNADPTPNAGWLAGLRDPLVAKALTLLHRQAARAWTLDALAAEAGTSRSVLAERFVQRVGQPAMQYLTAWRMQLAARLLADSTAKVKAVAEAAGYQSEAAFSRAFKKAAGMSPANWRQGERSPLSPAPAPHTLRP
jgi:AraC-like DNA-binding protein